jgi:L-asparaginase
VIPEGSQDHAVALYTVALGDDGRLLPAIEEQGFAGLVIEALGGGHVPSVLVEKLEDLARKIPVILTSRTGTGEVLRATYGFPGSETDLLERGLTYAGPLNGPKARLLLTLLLRSGAAEEEIMATFDSWLDE